MLLRLLIYVVPTFLISYFFWYLLYANLFWFNWICCTTILSIISWTIGYYFWEINSQEQVQAQDKIVLVTGCDTGFGNRLAEKLDQFGFHVYAGVLFPDGKEAENLKQKCSNRLKVVEMDITKPSQVEQVLDEINQAGKPLWAVVNNAGIGISTPFDWGKDVDVYQKTFEINLLGMVRVTKASIPLLRKSKGRVVNVASLAGRVCQPILSHYCMSKHSVRVFSNVLRLELASSGIKIVNIEPEFYKTQIINHDIIEKQREQIFSETPDQIKQFYNEDFRNNLKSFKNIVDMMARSNVDEVVDDMFKGVTLKHPKLFYRCCGYSSVLLLWATAHFPEVLQHFVHTFFSRLVYHK